MSRLVVSGTVRNMFERALNMLHFRLQQAAVIAGDD
jgi:hypothetical protein